MERTDHCVSSLGLVFRVLYTTSATCSSVLDRGAPERSSSCKPWSPFSRKRRRHLPTVARVTPTAAATASLGQPSAASRLISARRTNPWERLRDLAIDSNRSRSDGLSSNGGNGRPVTIGLSFQKGDKRNLRHLQLFVQLITRQNTSSAYFRLLASTCYLLFSLCVELPGAGRRALDGAPAAEPCPTISAVRCPRPHRCGLRSSVPGP